MRCSRSAHCFSTSYSLHSFADACPCNGLGTEYGLYSRHDAYELASRRRAHGAEMSDPRSFFFRAGRLQHHRPVVDDFASSRRGPELQAWEAHAPPRAACQSPAAPAMNFATGTLAGSYVLGAADPSVTDRQIARCATSAKRLASQLLLPAKLRPRANAHDTAPNFMTLPLISIS
jgi:hypothetical protein